MTFLSSGAFTSFTANTKAKSAEVNANFAALYNFFNTATSEALVGSVWQKIASTAASHTITSTDSIRVLTVNVNTSTGYTVFLPTAASNTYRQLTIKNIGATIGVLTIDPFSTETVDGTTTIAMLPKEIAELHCDGTAWVRTNEAIGELAISITYNSGIFTSQSVTGLLRRAGRMVILELPSVAATTNATGTNAATSNTPIPAYLRPSSENVRLVMSGLVNNVSQAGTMVISPGGNISFSPYVSESTTITAGTANTGHSRCTAVWALA